jgi:hypothetical protein
LDLERRPCCIEVCATAAASSRSAVAIVTVGLLSKIPVDSRVNRTLSMVQPSIILRVARLPSPFRTQFLGACGSIPGLELGADHTINVVEDVWMNCVSSMVDGLYKPMLLSMYA